MEIFKIILILSYFTRKWQPMIILNHISCDNSVTVTFLAFFFFLTFFSYFCFLTIDQPKKKKNISRDDLGNKLGRIHMKTQAFDKLQVRKVKGLKKRKAEQEVNGTENEMKKQKTEETAAT